MVLDAMILVNYQLINTIFTMIMFVILSQI